MKSGRLDLVLFWHHHQPVGNLPEVLEDCYQRCYLPLLDCLAGHPSLRFNLFYNGPLIEFFEERHPEFIGRLAELVRSGVVEVVGGPFYEPILNAVPEEDRRWHLNLMRDWMRARLGVEPRGGWLPESVWGQNLAETFCDSGLQYTILRAERFLRAGMREADLFRVFVTEWQSKTLRLFAETSVLSQHLPYGEVDGAMGALRRLVNQPSARVALVSEPAERWGVWPGSFERVFEQKILEDFLKRLEDAGGRIRLKRFGDILDEDPELEPIYPPTGVDAELGAWSLSEAARQRFFEVRDDLSRRHDAAKFLSYLSCGSWGGFRIRYPEANLMEKKGQAIRRWLRQSGGLHEEAVKRLLRAQCNTAYWFGTSGGIYLPHLRQAIWRELLEVEREMRSGQVGWRVEVSDWDADGRPEWAVHSAKASFLVDPGQGGQVLEWSLLDSRINLANTMRRQPESHTSEVNRLWEGIRNERLGEVSVDDRVFKRCFFDHFFERGVRPELLERDQHVELGNFLRIAYRPELLENETGIHLTLVGDGQVLRQLEPQDVRVVKVFHWEENPEALRVDYEIHNTGTLPLEGMFATGLHWLFSASQDFADKIYVGGDQVAQGTSWCGVVEMFRVFSAEIGVEMVVDFHGPKHLWTYPLHTHHQGSGGSASWLQQGRAYLIGTPIDLKVGERARFCLDFLIKKT